MENANPWLRTEYKVDLRHHPIMILHKSGYIVFPQGTDFVPPMIPQVIDDDVKVLA